MMRYRRPCVVLLWSVSFLFTSQATIAQTVFLEDDFEDYFTDEEVVNDGEWQILEVNMPNEVGTQWTITGQRGVPPNERGVAPEVGTTQFMISDSDLGSGADDQGTGMSHDLVTPRFDTTGSDVVWLHVDCQAILNNNGLGTFDIDASTDEGETWTNVFRRVAPARTQWEPVVTTENAHGFYGRLHVDLSAAAANSGDVLVRFRQFEPDDEWWISIDNVLIDDQPPTSGGTVNLLVERFTGGIPNTWTVASANGNTGLSTWTGDDQCSRHVSRSGGFGPDRHVGRLDENFAIVDPACSGAVTADALGESGEMLITPVVDCSQATAVFAHWKSEIVNSDIGIAEVLLSLDGGQTFEEEPIFAYDSSAMPGGAASEDPFYAERILEIPDAAGQRQVAIAFHYAGIAEAHFWAIDDVKISADGVAARNCASEEFEVSKFDAATSSVTMTWRGLPEDEGYRILRDGTDISGDLAADVRRFVDVAPPAGGGAIVYTLQVLIGGAVDLECPASPVSVVSCPTDFRCCPDQSTGAVTVNWTGGVNLAGQGFRVSRNGIPLRTLPLTAETFTDTPPGPGTWTYELLLLGANQSQCPDLTLSCTASIAGGDSGVLFADDFECYADDDDVDAAGWRRLNVNDPVEVLSIFTITNPGSRPNPPTEDGTPSTGKFLISDSDAQSGSNPPGTGMSHDLWSPEIDASGAAVVWLHMDLGVQLNDNGFAIFDVDVSVDGEGLEWENLFRRIAPSRGNDPLPTTENTDGFYGRLHLDLTDHVAGEKFRFRLRHFEPNFDWWVAVDNVLVDTNPAPQGGNVELLAREDFFDGIPPQWLIFSALDNEEPDTWQSSPENFDALCRFFQEGIVAGRGINRIGPEFALADPGCRAVSFDEFLVTPPIDAGAVTEVFLHYNSEVMPQGAAREEVLLSLDGGETFEEKPVFSYAAGGILARGEEPVYAERIFSVPEAVGQSNVAFAFHYRGNPGNGWWAITGVEVTGAGDVVVDRPRFRRGDAGNTGGVNITSAIFILNFLFTDVVNDLPCMDAGDVNNDGAVNITDPVNLLNHLFGTAPPPAAPGLESCGPDPDEAGSPGDLGCAEYTTC